MSDNSTQSGDDLPPDSGTRQLGPTEGGASLRLKPGSMFGRYRVLRLIGEGGMGAVYEAEQESPHRTVALKVIRPGLASPELLRRFDQECDALGRLQHPGIAQIYEAGTADSGFGPQPYFAMELIRGRSLTEHAAARSLSVRERLELVRKVADAVHHAHQRGLIHRDIKPGNIIVDESGQPRILDFGVARVTDKDTQATLRTDPGELIGTLAYMSPEQVLADPMELDTRSDVYALGVILYELLSGRLPHDIRKRFHEVILAIREEDPEPLSAINRTFRGDIETIAAKALEKDIRRRYSSAAELAADIERYLNDEPIVARPPSAAYQLRKFAKRNKAIVAGLATTLAVFLAGAIVSTRLAIEANRERDKTASERMLNIWQLLARESIRLSASRSDDDLAALLARQAMIFHERSGAQSQDLIETALQQAAHYDFWIHDISVRAKRSDAILFNASFFGFYDGKAWNLMSLEKPTAPPLLLKGPVEKPQFSSGSSHFVARDSSGRIYVWDLRSPGTAPVILQGQADGFIATAISADGTWLAESADDVIRVWALRSPGLPPATLSGRRGLRAEVLKFSVDGTQLAAALRFMPGMQHKSEVSQSVLVWQTRDLSTAPMALQTPPGWDVFSVVFSSDGGKIAVDSDDIDTTAPGKLSLSANYRVRVWDLHNPGKEPLAFSGRRGTFSADGSMLAAISSGAAHDGNEARVWDLRRPNAPPLLFQGSSSAGVDSVDFMPNGSQLLVGHRASDLLLWDLRNPRAQPKILPSREGGDEVAISPKGNRIVRFESTDGVRIWEPVPAGDSPLFVEPQGTTSRAAMALAGFKLATLRAQTLRIQDLRNAIAPLVLMGKQEAPILEIALSDDGLHLASGLANGTVEIWDLRNPSRSPLTLRVSPDADFINRIQSLRFSSDGQRLVVGRNGEMRLWDINHPENPAVLFQGEGSIGNMAFSGDSRFLAFSLVSRPRIIDLRSPNRSAGEIGHLNRPIFSGFAFSPDDMKIAASSSGPVAFSRAGWRVAADARSGVSIWKTTDLDGADISLFGDLPLTESAVALWDLRNPGAAPTLFRTPRVSLSAIQFSPDDKYLMGAMTDGSVWRWSLGAATADYLCTRVWRSLSTDEWRTYIGEGVPYERTCPALAPAASRARGNW